MMFCCRRPRIRRATIALCLLLATRSVPAEAPPQHQRAESLPTVAVVWEAGARTAGRLAPLVESALLARGGYRFVERDAIRKVLSEHVLAAAGRTAAGRSIDLGQLVSADAVVVCGEDLAADSGNGRFTVAGIHVTVYEVATSLTLADVTVALPGDPFTAADLAVAAIAEAAVSGLSKYPAARKGIRTIAVTEPGYGAWDRSLFPSAAACRNLMGRLLLCSDRVALVERRTLGKSTFERFIADKPPPLPADTTVETFFRRDAKGGTVMQSRLRGSIAVDLPEVVCDELTEGVVRARTREILDRLSLGSVGLSETGDRAAEARRLFLRAYQRARVEDYDEAYELVQASIVLNPQYRNARLLGDRLYALILNQAGMRGGELESAAQEALIPEVESFIENYFARLRTWFAENRECLMGSTEITGFGDLDGGYELGPEGLADSWSFIHRQPRLMELRRRKAVEFGRFYKELVESTRDPRMLHRPSTWSDVGPETLYAYFEGITNSVTLFETARRYFEFESGAFAWDAKIAPHVRGYSARAHMAPRSIARRYADGSLCDWARLETFLAELRANPGDLAALWSGLVMDGLWDRLPGVMRTNLTREGLRSLLVRSAVSVAAGLSRDGCEDRQYRDRSMLIEDCTGNLWASLSPETLAAVWEEGKRLAPDCASIVAAKTIAAHEARRDWKSVSQFALEAMSILRPGANGYGAIVASCRRASIALKGETGDSAGLGETLCLFDSGRDASGSACGEWAAIADRAGDYSFTEMQSRKAFNVAVATGKISVYDFPPAREHNSAVFGRWRSGAVCDGWYCFSSPGEGICAVDLRSGAIRAYTTTNGLFSDDISSLCGVRGKIYGVAFGRLTPNSVYWDYGRKRTFLLFELDPKTGATRELDGTAVEGGRLEGAHSVDWLGVCGDEKRNGLWFMETWMRLHFPHFYDLDTGRWTRIRINAFQWRLNAGQSALKVVPEGVLFGEYLYAPELDAFSYLPSPSTAFDDTAGPRVLDVKPPVATWRGQVWGVSSDGRLARVSDDGRATLYAANFLPAGYSIERISATSNHLAVAALTGDRRRLQIWRVRPAEPSARTAADSQPAAPGRAAVETPAAQLGPAVVFENTPLPDLRAAGEGALAPLDGLAEGSAEAQTRQVACGRETGLPIEVENGTGIRLRLVPPGVFSMGNVRAFGAYSMWRGTTVRRVTISRPLYVGKYEVTQEEWSRIMGRPTGRFGPRGPRMPAEEITWNDCLLFLSRICERERVPAGTYRLLTEAEWEYAARAGTDTLYCFGDDLREGKALFECRTGVYPYFLGDGPRGNSNGNSVGQFHPNAWGLHDMHGSVAEWCQDLYWWRYPATPAVNPVQETLGWRRVFRGGSRYDGRQDCSVYFCEYARIPHDVPARGLGVRIARQLDSGGAGDEAMGEEAAR
jgi:formylglycine-generating enzyme required for sulfatase activity